MNYSPMKTALLLWAVSLAGTGCATSSQYSDRIDAVRSQYESYASQEDYFEKAPKAMQSAQDALNELDQLVDDRSSEEKIEHQLYIAERKVALAQSQYHTQAAKDQVASAKEKRQEVLLNAKERKLTEAEREAQLAKQAAASFANQAAAAQQKLSSMEDRAAELESKVEALNTRQTARGLVLTLKDILFEFDKSQLKAGYDNTVNQLAEFLNEYPERSIAIEGYTDSVGSEDYNKALSERRAQNVKEALTDAGVAANRIDIKGMGEAKPVASNSTEVGRQQNRRVEIILENSQEMAASNDN